MHDISQWNEQDLLLLIENAVQESIGLDYKACDALQSTDRKKTEISKDVSAFANSAGGTIVYGINEKGHIPTSLDNGFNPNEITKEWLEQVINSSIHRKINNILIKPIELEKTNPGRFVYVVNIPQSSRAPHQAKDKRFYKRYNFQSVPMEEYEIRDISHRSDGPELSLAFEIDKITTVTMPNGNNSDTKEISRVHLNPLIENNSIIPAEYIAIHLYIDNSIIRVASSGEFKKINEAGFLHNGEIKRCTQYNMNHSVQSKIPIFKGSRFLLLSSPILIDIENDGDYFISYSLLAPYMEEKTGSVLIQFENDNAKIREI
jgi:hypothetical protein